MLDWGGDRSDPLSLSPLPLTKRQLAMQHRLFGPHVRDVARVADASVGRVLRELAGAPELRSLRIWLVGSRLTRGRTSSDTDIVLSPCVGTTPSDHLVERALWHCREYGLYGAVPACVIDPCYRVSGPTVAVTPLRPHTRITTVKLLSPRLVALVASGRIREYRQFGSFAIEYLRPAHETSYFRKLPRGNLDGSVFPYLRPAVEIALDGPDAAAALSTSSESAPRPRLARHLFEAGHVQSRRS